MTSSVRSGLRIRPFEDGDEARVLDLLRLAMGPGPTGNRSLEFFRWKHLTNPFGRSLMLLAEADGEVIGLRAFLRWNFRAGSNRLNAVRAVDTATHPDYRRGGVFSKLTAEALGILRSEAVDLVFNTPNQKSLPGYLKLGWSIVGKIPVVVRVIHPWRVTKALRSLPSQQVSTLRKPDVAASPLGVVLEESVGVSEFLEAAMAESQGIATIRNVDYLRWRYQLAPGFDYRAVAESVGGRLNGLAVFRVRPRGNVLETTITELLTRPADRPTRARLLRRVLAAAPVDHATLVPSTRRRWRSQFARSGFFPSFAGITLAVNPLGAKTSPNPVDLESWALSLGDVEAL